MPNLESYIKNHLDEFDSPEPEPGHFRRFGERLNEQQGLKPEVHSRSQMLKIAALIIILITVSVFVFDYATREIKQRLGSGKEGTELPVEIMEADQYYDNQTNTQISTIRKLAATREDAVALNATALHEIAGLDATANELKKSLAENPGNERILDAIIRNQQIKEAMLNTIITQLSHQNNQSIQRP